MRTLHFDCFSGVSGDMILGALVEVGLEPPALSAALAGLNLGIEVRVAKVKRGGFVATKVDLVSPDQSPQRFLPQIEAIIDRANLSTSVKDRAKAIFRRLGAAEAKVHDLPIEKVHFHEVGAADAIGDIVGAAFGMEFLNVAGFTSRSVPVGSGTIQCEHGEMPVPTPATAELLKGVPIGASPITTELTTPTGAAILTSFVSEFVQTPVMTIDKIGMGAGTKDFPGRPNVLRIFLGDSGSGKAASVPGIEAEPITVLETNLDQMTPEAIGYAIDRLWAAGALDVYLIPIQMKKFRPGVMLGVVCRPANREALESVIFRETGTLGIRCHDLTRAVLSRKISEVETRWGRVRVKAGGALGPGGAVTIAPEYEDCARIAREHAVPLREVVRVVMQAAYHQE